MRINILSHLDYFLCGDIDVRGDNGASSSQPAIKIEVDETDSIILRGFSI